jgi:hypothetical protein
MENENPNQTKINIWFAWLIANAIGLGLGWALGELVGIQVAETLGWRYGQMVGVVIFEGLIWMTRWAVISRIRAYDALKPIEAFFWILTELLVWFGVESSRGETSYRADSLFGIISASILSYFLGVIGWLILWLIKTQAQKSQLPVKVGHSILSSFARVGGSLLIFGFFILCMPFSTAVGEAIAKSWGLVFGRAVAGILMGGMLGSITGLALLKLMIKPTWEE